MYILKIILAFIGIFVVIFSTLFFIANRAYNFTNETQVTFVSDGCTLFPDGNWGECCVVHDIAYWDGGSKTQRLHADQVLASCIVNHTQSLALSNLVFLGVRLGGTPFLPTYWRWGFGWAYGRGYVE